MITGAGILLRVPETDQQSQCIGRSKIGGNFVEFVYERRCIVRWPQGVLQLVVDVIVKTEVRKRKALFKNRGLGEECERCALDRIRWGEKDFAIPSENCPRDMSIG